MWVRVFQPTWDIPVGGGREGAGPPTFRYPAPPPRPRRSCPPWPTAPGRTPASCWSGSTRPTQAGRRPGGGEAILAAAREAGLPCSQQEVRRILAGLDRAGLVRVSRGRGGTRLSPGRAGPVPPAGGGGRSGNGLT